jgi:DNA-binding XRE family transcriptional regulator
MYVFSSLFYCLTKIVYPTHPIYTDFSVIVSSVIIYDFSVMDNDKEILLKLAVRLKALRKSMKVTQEEVYNATGVHIARVEQGKRDISYTTLRKLAQYFQVSLSEFDE